MPKISKRYKKTVYLPMAVDIIHHGHINIINIGRELGSLTVGLLTDQAIARYKRVPLSTFAERKKVIENIVGVERVIAQETDDYIPIIKQLKPDFFVHGDDWKTGIQAEKRARVIKTMATWGGQVIEPSYTKGISTTQLIAHLTTDGITPERRVNQLKRILDVRSCAHFIEAPIGLVANIAERIRIPSKERTHEFDGFWLSHRTEAIIRGHRTLEPADFTLQQQTVDQILTATKKPLLFELDSKNTPKQLASISRSLARLGTSAVVLSTNYPELEQVLPLIKGAVTSPGFCLFLRQVFPTSTKEQHLLIERISSLQTHGLTGVLFEIEDQALSDFSLFCQSIKKRGSMLVVGVILQPSSRLKKTRLAKSGAQIVIHESHLLAKLQRPIEEALHAILLDKPPINKQDLDAYQELLTWASTNE